MFVFTLVCMVVLLMLVNAPNSNNDDYLSF